MQAWITLALKIWEHITNTVDRETDSTEDLKEYAVKDLKNGNREKLAATKIFAGDKYFEGVDALATRYFSPKELKEYRKRRLEYNKYSA